MIDRTGRLTLTSHNQVTLGMGQGIDVPPGEAGAQGRQLVGALLQETEQRLAVAGLPDSRAESRDLVAAICEKPRFWPTMHPDEMLSENAVRSVRSAAARRIAGAPFAYAVGRAAFRYLTLVVDERVLIPRQETEVLVDLVLAARADTPGGIVADIGTGSGAIALALACEGHFERVIATDIARDALCVAEHNAHRLHERLRTPIEFRCGADLAPLCNESIDVIVANPPYIAYRERGLLPASVRDWEPPQALFSDVEGLRVFKSIIGGAAANLRNGGLIALEVDTTRACVVADLASLAGFDDVRIERDLGGRERFVLASWLL